MTMTITELCQVRCDLCGRLEEAHRLVLGDAFPSRFLGSLHREGWTPRDERHYCPHCSATLKLEKKP
jgi:hypothetical protein